MTKDKDIIQKRIKEVIKHNQVLSLEIDDFSLFPKAYIQFEFCHLNELKDTLHLLQAKIMDIIVSINSNQDVELSKINDVVECIQNTEDYELNIIYGYHKDPDQEGILIDIFIIN